MPRIQDAFRLQPPARLPLVSRRAELASLRSLLELAASGEPGVALITGEIGIGKSRLAREAMALAEGMGVAVCEGRFSQGSEVPFLALRGAFIARCARAGLLDDPANPHVAVLQAMTGGTSRTPGPLSGPDRGEAQLALWWAVSALAARRPFLYVVDDLQWADNASLEVLLNLVEAIADAAAGGDRVPFTLILVSRPAGQASRLEHTLSRTRHEPPVTWLPLVGLDEIETNEFVVACAGAPSGVPLLNFLMRTAEGNPLFIAETLAQMNAGAVLSVEHGRLTASGAESEVVLPSEVQGAMSARAASLEPAARSLLSLAAIIGDDFTTSLLAELSGETAASVAQRLRDAETAGFVAETAEGWRFAHSIFRRSLAAQLPLGQRNRLHFAIAERPGAASELSPSLLAHHLLEAGALAAPEAVGRAALLAGEHALGASAYGQAGRMLEAAVGRPAFVATLSPCERGDLLYRCGFAHYRDMSVDAARTWFEAALHTYREAGDLSGWGRALIGLLRARNAHGRLAIGESIERREYDDFMLAAGDALPAMRAAVKAMWAELLHNARSSEAGSVSEEALELATAAGDSFTSLHACFDLARYHLARLEPAAALARNEEAYRHAQTLDDRWYHLWGLQNLSQAHFALGRLGRAEALAHETVAASREVHDWAIESLGRASLAAVALVRGDFDEAERQGAGALALYRRSDYSYTPAVLLPPLAYGRALRGEWEAAEDALALLESVAGADATWTLRQLFRAWKGELAEVRAEIDAHPRRASWRQPPDMFSLATAACRLELGVALGIPQLAEYPLALFEAAQAGGVEVTFGPGYVVERGLGVACFALGRIEEAEASLRAAISRADHMGARTEAARARLDLARLLLDADGSPEEAESLLVAAVRELDFLRISRVATEARKLAERAAIELPAAPAGPYPAGFTDFEFEVLVELARGRDATATADALLLSARTVRNVLLGRLAPLGIHGPPEARAFLTAHGRLFPETSDPPPKAPGAKAAGGTLAAWMFTDIVDSTELNTALGDAAWDAALVAHDLRVNAILVRHGGSLVKSLGDGMFMRFSSATAAVACGLEIQAAFPMALERLPGRAVAIRVGIHVGDAIERDGDVIGLAVTTAKRICDVGTAGEVVVSESVSQLATRSRFRFEDRGRFGLKGLGEMLRLYAVQSD
ncbi:MAG: AAA family ATPase [Tepidiformaceae bacterium]